MSVKKDVTHMKLNERFICHQIDGQTVIVPTSGAGFHGLIQGNKTLAAIAECLNHDTTARFNGNREDIKADVAEAINRLKEIGAIDE